MAETCIRFGPHGARIMIEEKEIPHYAMHIDPAKKEVSCWIASEAGKVFSVVWLEPNVKYPTAGKLYLDGRRAAYRPCQNTGPRVFKHVSVSQSSCAPLLFSPLVVTDDDTYLDTPSHSIGEIKLVISRTTVAKKIQKKSTTIITPPDLQKVHERSKKAIAHRVNYGTKIPSARTTCAFDTLETLVTFIFRYRPLEMLFANGIVPRNPEPIEPREHALDTPPTSKLSSGKGEHSRVKKEAESGPGTDDSNEDSTMREKALLAEVQRCQAEVERIRKARGRHSKESERPKKKLKREDKPFFIPGEIIDLT